MLCLRMSSGPKEIVFVSCQKCGFAAAAFAAGLSIRGDINLDFYLI